jgi:O-succinylbenzoic acid--CoA ligase
MTSTVAALLDARAADAGVALDGGDARWSWADLRDAVDAEGAPPRGGITWVDTSTQGRDAGAPLVGLLQALAGAGTIALPHPRWPAALTRDVKASLGDVEPPPAPGAQTLLFTSGSTGRPKAVLHRVDQHIAAAKASNARVPFGPGDRWLLSLPLCHVGGLAIVFRALVSSGGMVLPLPGERATDALIRRGPSHVSLVAAQLTELLEHDAGVRALRGCREVLVGGGPVAPALVRRAADAGIPLRQTYGATEMGSQACTSAPGAPTSCGRPLDGITIIVGDDGMVAVNGPSRFLGYLDRTGLHRPFAADGSWATGDIGHIDDDDGLVVDGRADHRFISGGENIHPEMVEAALAAVPGVQQAVVVDVPDDRFGARPAAFLALSDARALADGAMPTWLKEALAPKLPRFMVPVVAWPLPPSAGIKPARAALRALACERLGLGPQAAD